MTTEPDDVQISFAEVAAEQPHESLQREVEATDEIEAEAGPAQAATVGEANTAPEPPHLASLLGFGPVAPGDDAVI